MKNKLSKDMIVRRRQVNQLAINALNNFIHGLKSNITLCATLSPQDNELIQDAEFIFELSQERRVNAVPCDKCGIIKEICNDGATWLV